MDKIHLAVLVVGGVAVLAVTTVNPVRVGVQVPVECAIRMSTA